MFKEKLKIGERRACAEFDVTLCWCAACCGQTARGYVRHDGKFLSTGQKGSCEGCDGMGRVWVPSEQVIEWLPCGGGMAVNLLSRKNPVKAFQVIPETAENVVRLPRPEAPVHDAPRLLTFVRWLCGSGHGPVRANVYW